MKKNSGEGMRLSKVADVCMQLLDKIITPKSLLCFFVIIYIAGLIPLFLIGCYNYPVADDYTFGAACRSVWMESHSVIMVIGRAATRAWEYYLSWAGCLSSSFFMALQPGVFGEGFYKLTPFIMVGIISFSSLYLMRVIFVKALKCNAYLINSISLFMLFVMIQCMPEPAEGLFWYNGALHYTFMHGISLFFYGLLISALLQKNERKKNCMFIGSAILGFIAAMGNYMTALNGGIVLALLIMWLVIEKKFKTDKFIIIPTVIFYLAFIINVTAPGNSVRAEVSDGMNPLKAVFASFYYVLDYCLGAWSGWVVLILVVMTATLFWNASKSINFDFPCPLLAVFLNYCILAAMITPPLFGTGNIEAGRIKSLIYIMYIFLLTLSVCYVTGWAEKKLDRERSVLSFNSKTAIAACILFLMAGSVLCIIPNPEYYTFSMAAEDILNGNAKAYGAAMQKRVEIYNASEGMDVEVEPLPIKPGLLCTSDISEDAGDWINAGVCRFYGLSSVRLKSDKD